LWQPIDQRWLPERRHRPASCWSAGRRHELGRIKYRSAGFLGAGVATFPSAIIASSSPKADPDQQIAVFSNTPPPPGWAVSDSASFFGHHALAGSGVAVTGACTALCRGLAPSDAAGKARPADHNQRVLGALAMPQKR